MNISDAFRLMDEGKIVKNGNWYYKKRDSKLLESLNGVYWGNVHEFNFGTVWEIDDDDWRDKIGN